MESPVLVRVEPGALVHGGGAAAMVTEEVVQRTLGMFAGPGLSVQSGEVMQTCALELETKVHTKERNLLVVLCLTNAWNNGKSGAKLDLTSSTTLGRYILGNIHIGFH